LSVKQPQFPKVGSTWEAEADQFPPISGKALTGAAIEAAVAKAKAIRNLGTVETFDAAETGVNILRVRRPDGTEEAVSAQT
jgi:hypothetical protein